MNRVLIIVLFLALAGVACKKKSSSTGCTYEKGTTVASATEKTEITAYLSSNDIKNAVEVENSGLYYVIDSLGTGAKPTSMCSYIGVTYSGKLSNDKEFDANTTTFTLGALVEGWKRALPLINSGSKIRLFIPGSMGYGTAGIFNSVTGKYTVPPNAMLIFTIFLTGVTN